MKLLRSTKTWLLQRWQLILVVALTLVILIFTIWLQRSRFQNFHTLGTSTQKVNLLWVNQNNTPDSFFTIAKDSPITMDLKRDNLVLFDARDGSLVWNKKIPFLQSGISSLLTNDHLIFSVTGSGVDAYDLTTGEEKWSTKLGSGHVPIISQLESSIIRIYYGDTIYEIDSKTGEVLVTFPKQNIVWISHGVILRESPAYALAAYNEQTNELLWRSNSLPYIRENYKPRDIGDNNLAVGYLGVLCILNIKTGNTKWCRSELELPNLAIDYQAHRGYIMKDDLVLLTMDLQSGNILGETNFLSRKPIDKPASLLSSISFSDGVLIVSFSDSGQTFGLEIQTP